MKVEGHAYQFATIDTLLVLLGLFIYNIEPILKVLVPDRQTCIEGDLTRDCWTGGEKWIDLWYDEQREYLKTHNEMCIDTSKETLEETFNKHFSDLI